MAEVGPKSSNDRCEILLEWKDVKYAVHIKDTKNKTEYDKEILHGMSGFANPGQFLAIMGSSGAGKTTLLNILSDRIGGSGKIEGDMTANGKPLSQIDFGSYSAYVMQDDVLLETMSPREAFLFSAKLRISGTVEEKIEKVEILIKELKLTKCADTAVGSVLARGISGGERKRCSIGVELVTDPSVLFLDEPTSGLDSYTSLVVIKLMVKQARTGRTILSTIHQPSSDIFNIFDRLLLLCDGNTIYQGAAKDATKHFNAIEYTCPTYSNPADYFMEQMHAEKRDAKTSEEEARFKLFNEHYANSQATIMAEKYSGQLTTIASDDNQVSSSPYYQFSLLCERSFKHTLRNPVMTKVKFGQTVVMVILICILYFDIGIAYSSIQNRNGLLFFICINQLMTGVQSVVLTFPLERALFLREQANGMYGVLPYYMGKTVSELPAQVFFPILFSACIYWTVGLNTHSSEKPLIFILLTIMVSLCGVSLGLLAGCIFSDVQVAVSAAPMCVIPFMLFGGFLTNTDSIPIGFIWLEYMSPFKYAFGAYAQNEYHDLDIDCEPGCTPLDDLNFTEDMWYNILYLFILILGYRVLAVIFLKLLVRKLGS